MSDTDFGIFFQQQRKQAAEAYTNGDSEPVLELIPERGPATFHSPRGDTVNGATAVADRFESDAKSFRPGGETEMEVLQSDESGELAFWTGFQHAKVKMEDQDHPVDMAIRVTEIFRREDGEWKMILRHADIGKPPQ
jgi:ketosteroid isomerase-like protein